MRLSVLIGLLMLAPVGLAHAERLPLKTYTTADGLPHNEINRIVRDSRGFLWFCTGDGLSKFDGYSFTNFGTAEGLPHRTVNDLLETRDGRLWVATSGGLALFDPAGVPDRRVVYAGTRMSRRAMFTVFLPQAREGLTQIVNSVVEDGVGTIWVGTGNGLYRLEKHDGTEALAEVDVVVPKELPEQPFVHRLLARRDGSLWIAAGSGLFRRWRDGTTASYAQRDGLPSLTLHDLIEDHEGQLWAASLTGGFFRVSSDQSHRPPVIGPVYGLRDGLPHTWVSQLFETHDHRFFIASPRGLVEFLRDPDEHGRRFRVYDSSHGLSGDDITALAEDAAGNLWLGSSTIGVTKITGSGFITYGESDGLRSVRALLEDQTGRLCFRSVLVGTRSGAVLPTERAFLNATLPVRYGQLEGGRITSFVPRVVPDGFRLGWVTEGVTLQTRNGEWWLGMVGIYRFPPAANFARIQSAKPLAYYTTEDGLAGDQTYRLFEDSRGGIWASTTSPSITGLARWDRTTGAWKDLVNVAGLAPVARDLARSFAEDRTGRVWIGFSGALAREDGARFRLFTEADGVPPGAIMNMHLDGSGRLWLASARSGLIRVDDPGAERPRFVSYSTAQGLSSDITEVVTDDRYGRIYVGTGRGLDRLDPLTGRIRHFTTADGLAPGLFRAAYRDHTGTLWFGTSAGLSRFDPAPDSPAVQPPILVSSVVVAGSRWLTSALGEGTIALPDLQPGQNALQIEYVGLDFAPGATLRYQFKLEGADADWSAPTLQRSVNYGNLAPGRYRFLVRAITDDEAQSRTPATVSFTILAPLWRRWWFLTLLAAGAVLGTSGVLRYRWSRIVELANVRARIALDLHDDIGSNLTKISILSEVAQQNPGAALTADGPLASIARISRESVAAMSDIVWAANPHRDRLLHLVRRMRQHAEEMFTTQGIALTFRAPGEDQDIRLGVDVRRDIFLIFKEALNNASRHGRCSAVEVDLRAEGPWLSLQVVDDGVGFDATVAGEGQGLLSMRRRTESLGGLCEVQTIPGKGTTIRVTIPTSARAGQARAYLNR